jgi:hypothetical protein
MNLESMTPLEALNRLAELQKKAGEGTTQRRNDAT